MNGLRLPIILTIFLFLLTGLAVSGSDNGVNNGSSNSVFAGSLTYQLKADEIRALLKQEKGSLSLQARIYWGEQDEEEFFVRGAKFFLLDENLVTILQKSGFEFEGVEGKSHDSSDYLSAAVKILRYPDDDENEILYLLLFDALKKHRQAEIETDHWGEAHLANIKAGKYYLFGYAEMNEEIFIWHLPINLKAGKNTVVLDQYNSESTLCCL